MTTPQIQDLIDKTTADLEATADELVRLHVRRRAEIGLRKIGHPDGGRFDGSVEAYEACARRLSELRELLESLRLALAYNMAIELQHRLSAVADRVTKARAAFVDMDDMVSLEGRRARAAIRFGMGMWGDDDFSMTPRQAEKFGRYRSLKGELEAAVAEEGNITSGLGELCNKNPGLRELLDARATVNAKPR